jgi:two-component sensor histidine kinase/PAS domain-containing protein
MATICLTIAINEFFTWFRRTKKNGDIAFVLICLGGTFFCACCAGEYSVDYPRQSIPWLRGEVIAISIAAFALFWYIAEETGLIRKRYLLAYLIWTALVISTQFIRLGNLTWLADKPFVLRVELPFGLNFVYQEVERGAALIAADLVGFAALGYLIVILAKYWRQGNRREATVLSIIIGVVIGAELVDFLVGIGALSFVFVMEYAWLTAILIVGLRRSNEIMDAIRTKRALQKSDRDLTVSQTMLAAIIDSTSDMIWSVDSATFGLLAFNQGFKDHFLRKDGIAIAGGMRPEDLYPSKAEIDFWRELYERARAGGAYSIEHSAFAGSNIHHLNINRLEREGKLFGLSVFAKDITERKESENKIRRSLVEKETLLQELYHRTKNNMNVIISMLKLQSREIGDERLKKAFSETENRIISMSLVHEKLYEAQDLSHINLKEYFEDLTRKILSNYSLLSQLPRLSLDMEEIYVSIDTAISCGLIVNELISNSLKYAFPSGRTGEIQVRLRQDSSMEISLRVSDDGIGMPPGFDPKRDGHLGMRLIENLARGKLRAQALFQSDHGASYTMKFMDNRSSGN